MKIRVDYFGQLRQITGVESEDGQWPDGTDVQTCLRGLADRYGEQFAGIVFQADGALRGSLVVLVNGDAIVKAQPRTLQDGDQVNLLAAIAGG